MRKLEQEMCEAIRNFKSWSKDNTCFHRMPGTDHGWELVLHGNTIATFDSGAKNPTVPTNINLCGWNTPTTRGRLNCLDGVNVFQKNRIPYLNGKEISEDGWYPVNQSF